MKFSLIIPTYNEAPIILRTISSLINEFEQRLLSDWEIIIADNASTDGTASTVESIRDNRIRIIRLHEKGKGRALRAGFACALGEVLGFTDADLSVPPDEILSAFERVSIDPELVIIGSRYHASSLLHDREWWRTGSSRMFNLLARTILAVHVRDTQCPLKVMSAKNAKVLTTTRDNTWFADLEFIAILERLKVPIEEIPVTWNEHRYPERSSKLSTIKDGFKAVSAMLRMRSRLPKLHAQLLSIKK